MNAFPRPEEVELARGVRARRYRFAGYELLIAELVPGASFQPHSHEEVQFGLCLHGEFEFEFDGRAHRLSALEGGYWLPPHTPHGVLRVGDSGAVAIDVKHRLPPEQAAAYGNRGAVLEITDERTWKIGLENRFFVGPWFEFMVTRIPPGGVMPSHAHYQEQIGVGLRGSYSMTVGVDTGRLGPGTMYFAAANVAHEARNDSAEEAASVNIFLPHRYHRKPDAPDGPSA